MKVLMNKNTTICFLALMFMFSSLQNIFGQEILLPLNQNPILLKQIKKSTYHQKSSTVNIIELPFIDDFSDSKVYPSAERWIDSNVFINNGTPASPITLGVATFDAINKHGYHYPDASFSTYIADYLTSQYIRLDSIITGIPKKIAPSDSVIFSFFVQPEGLANAPDTDDSLVLEFKSFPPDTFYVEIDTVINSIDSTVMDTITMDHWNRVWSSNGMSKAEFLSLYDTNFLAVKIPITDTSYFHKDFQFRFYNYASVANDQQPSWANNCDQWNIDYVYLNLNRSMKDSLIDDIAFRTPGSTMLTNYHSMPWSHYLVNPANETKTSISAPYINLSNTTRNVKRDFQIIDLSSFGAPYNYNGGNLNLDGLSEIDFNPPFSSTFASNTNSDTAVFEIRSIINTTPDINRSNDTASFRQEFYNYYSYDDGTPEAGYGLAKKNGILAYKFNSRKSDTLRGIQMFFNQTKDSASYKYFYIVIWKSISPEQIIYKKSGYRPVYSDSLNEFYTYRFDDTTLVINGDFYIGWQQLTADNLNIGFDANSEFGWNTSLLQNDNLLYNTDGTWRHSIKKGAIMMRPVFGNKFPYGVGINENINTEDNAVLFPNPGNGNFSIRSNFDFQNVQIYNTMGLLVKQNTKQESYSLEGLSKGIYYIRLTNAEKSVTLRYILND